MGNKNTTKSPVAARLREARLLVGLSQKSLGIKAGIDRFTSSARVNQYENGKHVPDFQTAKRLAKALNIPVTYLFSDDDELAELILKFSQASNSKKAKIKKFINNL